MIDLSPTHPKRTAAQRDAAITPVIITDVLSQRIEAANQQQLFERYVVPELDFVRRITRRFSSSAADGDDLMQDVLTNAFRAIGRFDGRYPKAWLYRIASNAAASRARRHRDTTSLPDDDRMDTEMYLAATDDVETMVIDGVFDPALASALDELPEHYRSVIDLVDVASFSYEAAAEQLGVPTGTVMSRLHRGRRRLRAELVGTHLDRARSTGRDSAPV